MTTVLGLVTFFHVSFYGDYKSYRILKSQVFSILYHKRIPISQQQERQNIAFVTFNNSVLYLVFTVYFVVCFIAVQ